MLGKPNIAILLPTRGLIFGDTIWSLENNLENFKNKIITIIGLPIPKAQNEAVKKALANPNYTHFFFCEEDIILPDGALKEMLKMDKDVVCVDYPVAGGWSTIKKVDGEIQHCGLGCTLIKRKVFETIPEPWFETNKSLDAKTGKILDIPMKYGGHDIFFGLKLKEYGFKIYQLEGIECGHLRCMDLNRQEKNDGAYEIFLLDRITKFQDSKEVKNGYPN